MHIARTPSADLYLADDLYSEIVARLATAIPAPLRRDDPHEQVRILLGDLNIWSNSVRDDLIAAGELDPAQFGITAVDAPDLTGLDADVDLTGLDVTPDFTGLDVTPDLSGLLVDTSDLPDE